MINHHVVIGGIEFELLLSNLLVLFLPLGIGSLSIVQLAVLAFVINETDEVADACNLECVVNLFSTVHEHDLWFVAQFLLSEIDGTDATTG